MMRSPGWTPASDENAMPPGEASIDSQSKSHLKRRLSSNEAIDTTSH
jgi:hypothetical protein